MLRRPAVCENGLSVRESRVVRRMAWGVLDPGASRLYGWGDAENGTGLVKRAASGAGQAVIVYAAVSFSLFDSTPGRRAVRFTPPRQALDTAADFRQGNSSIPEIRRVRLPCSL